MNTQKGNTNTVLIVIAILVVVVVGIILWQRQVRLEKAVNENSGGFNINIGENDSN
jgi:hypothetical protein